jgi:cytochrome c biogenesis protein CcmG, thiol:disulfide interchange protein DsbE
MQRAKTDQFLKAGIAVLLGLLAFVIYDSIHEKLVQVGDTAPEFTVTTDAGRTVSRENFGGKLLVLNFWATWCPPCVEEMPSLEQFAQQFSKEGVVVLGISVDKDPNAYRSFLDRAQVSFLTARDPEQRINADYGTFKYPETYIINAEGKVVEKIIGDRKWTDPRMTQMIRSFL